MANYPGFNPYVGATYAQNGGYGAPYMGAQNMGQMPAQVPVVNNVPAQNVSQPGFVCRPVASLEEALGTPTDFGGAITIMTDLPHDYIYTKVLNPATGSSVFGKYKKVNDDGASAESTSASAPVPAVDYTPMFAAITDRLDQVTDGMEQMSDRVEDLFDRIESQKKAAMRAERKAVSANE